MLYVGYFSGVGPRTQRECLRCNHKLDRQERVRPVFIVGEVRVAPEASGKVLVLAGSPTKPPVIYNEFVHARCDDVMAREVNRIIPPKRKYPVMHSEFSEIEPRGREYQCVFCKKDFEREDRIFTMHMVIGIGTDKNSGQIGAACSGNYEVAHVDCKDPKLTGGGSILLVG